MLNRERKAKLPGQLQPAAGEDADSAEPAAASPERSLAAHGAVLDLLADGAPLPQVLDRIARTVEQTVGTGLASTHCALVLAEAGGNGLRFAAAPSLPAGYRAAADGLLKEQGAAGSRGSPPGFDAATLHLQQAFRELAGRHGLKPCWSQPVISRADETLGAVVLYADRPVGLDDTHAAPLETAARLIRLAIEAERRNQALQDEAAIARRAKNEFLANMSHELRTPLNVIIGFAEIMKNELLGSIGNPTYADYCRDIHVSGTHLLAIINDILDISRIEIGALQLAESPVSVAELVESCVRLTSQRAQDAGLTLQVEVAPELPPLFADERMMKQILNNLLSNAVKFTPKGGAVTVRAAPEPDGMLTLAVADTGIGMAPEDIPHALEHFGQLDASYGREHSGAGLGLPLVKALTELHGGVLRLESAPGQGTTASVRFPRGRVLDGA